MNEPDFDDSLRQIMHQLSSKAFHKRAHAIKELHKRMKCGCWLSRLMLEYVLDHDPNSAIKNRISLIFKRSSFSPREGIWEKHTCF